MRLLRTGCQLTPVVGTQDTIVILCANCKVIQGFPRSARTKVVSCFRFESIVNGKLYMFHWKNYRVASKEI
jgi:hypothetical protein